MKPASHAERACAFARALNLRAAEIALENARKGDELASLLAYAERVVAHERNKR